MHNLQTPREWIEHELIDVKQSLHQRRPSLNGCLQSFTNDVHQSYYSLSLNLTLSLSLSVSVNF